MNAQHSDDPHIDKDQRTACEWTAEQLAHYEQRMAELSRLALQAGLSLWQAEDVAQTVYQRFLENQPSFTGANAAEREHAWFLSVARHEIANVQREALRHPTVSLETLMEEPKDRRREESSASDREADLKRLQRALGELSEQHAIDHRLLVGRYMEKRSIKELAAAEGLTVRAVYNRLDRGRAWLKARLLADQNEDTSSEEA